MKRAIIGTISTMKIAVTREAQSGQGVVDAAYGPGEVERQHLVPLVAADDFRGLGDAEQDHEEAEPLEVVAVREQVGGSVLADRLLDGRREGQLNERRRRRTARSG